MNPVTLSTSELVEREGQEMTAETRVTEIPTFHLQKHHSQVRVPHEFDLRDLSRKYHIFPLRVIKKTGKKRLLLAMRNPHDHKAIDDVEFRSGVVVIPVQADEIDIQWLIHKHYYGRPLTPTPSLKPEEVTHDLFEQLTITTDAQKRPNWVNENLELYTINPEKK